jgi:hypothetical protein
MESFSQVPVTPEQREHSAEDIRRVYGRKRREWATSVLDGLKAQVGDTRETKEGAESV